MDVMFMFCLIFHIKWNFTFVFSTAEKNKCLIYVFNEIPWKTLQINRVGFPETELFTAYSALNKSFWFKKPKI